MKTHKPNFLIHFGICIVFIFIFTCTLSAQQKLTVQLSDGTSKHYSLSGLKLTFDNNGSFSLWQNNKKQDLSFVAVDKIIFTEQASVIQKNNFWPLISYYVDQSGMLNIEGELMQETEVCIYSLHGDILFRKKQLITVPIDISSFKPGFYVLKAGIQYIKFLRL